MGKVLKIVYLLALIIMFFQCGEKKTTNENSGKSMTEYTIEDPKMLRFDGRLFSIPSPFQVSMLVKQIGLVYNKELMNSYSNTGKYATTFKLALNLGVFGADLGYASVNEQYAEAIKYFSEASVIAKQLDIPSFLDEPMSKRINSNQNNRDSLLNLAAIVFRQADASLLNNSRNDISVLILAGGWIESMHFLTKTASSSKNQQVIDRIGEQKHPLDNVIEIMRPYYGKQTDNYDQLLEELVELATVFDGVIIEYTYVPPETDAINKITSIKSKTRTIITDHQLKNISDKITALRAKIID